MRILLLEDNYRFAMLLKEHLCNAGHVVDIASSLAEFRLTIRPNTHDLLIVDLSLPDGDGFEAIRACRASKLNTPILIASGSSSVKDRVLGLDSGADDFITKPFNVSELLARVRALMRRPVQIQSTRIQLGRLTVDPSTGEVSLDDTSTVLSHSERQLLALLVRRRGAVVSKEAIDGQIHGRDSMSTPNAVEQLVSRLRKSLAKAQVGVDVRTVRGSGYVLELQ